MSARIVSSLLGTWKLNSHVVTGATGERTTPYGEHPMGYLSYSADGRMQVIGAASGRMVLAGTNPSSGDRTTFVDTVAINCSSGMVVLAN